MTMHVRRVTQRNEDRKERAAASAASRHTEKIGYVPRNKQAAGMSASGLTSAGMMGKSRNDPSQTLDEDSVAGLARLREQDAEIDAGIDQISRQIDNLTNIAGAMKDEVVLSYYLCLLCYHRNQRYSCFYICINRPFLRTRSWNASTAPCRKLPRSRQLSTPARGTSSSSSLHRCLVE